MHRIVLAVALMADLTSTGASLSTKSHAISSLQEALQRHYRVTTTGSDAEGYRVTEPGTILIIRREGILPIPHAGSHGIAFKLPQLCHNTFRSGVLTTPKACISTTVGLPPLGSGERVYITKFEVTPKSGKITFNLVECDLCNGTTGRSSMLAIVIFEFDAQFLERAQPAQVEDVINQVLETENTDSSIHLDGDAVR